MPSLGPSSFPGRALLFPTSTSRPPRFPGPEGKQDGSRLPNAPLAGSLSPEETITKQSGAPWDWSLHIMPAMCPLSKRVRVHFGSRPPWAIPAERRQDEAGDRSGSREALDFARSQESGQPEPKQCWSLQCALLK